MALIQRGWSQAASAAMKLAMAEKIIGYQFKNVDRLYEALDQTKQPKSLIDGTTILSKRSRNTRLALVGDAEAQLYLARKWYDHGGLDGTTWNHLAALVLSNENLARKGFSMGLDECAIPATREQSTHNMASIVEAVFAAVRMDGADEAQVRRVMHRFGIHHKIIDQKERAWVYKAVRSGLILPDRYFAGHHFKLQEVIFEINPTSSIHGLAKPKAPKDLDKSPPAQKDGPWGRFKLFWLGPAHDSSTAKPASAFSYATTSKPHSQAPSQVNTPSEVQTQAKTPPKTIDSTSPQKPATTTNPGQSPDEQPGLWGRFKLFWLGPVYSTSPEKSSGPAAASNPVPKNLEENAKKAAKKAAHERAQEPNVPLSGIVVPASPQTPATTENPGQLPVKRAGLWGRFKRFWLGPVYPRPSTQPLGIPGITRPPSKRAMRRALMRAMEQGNKLNVSSSETSSTTNAAALGNDAPGKPDAQPDAAPQQASQEPKPVNQQVAESKASKSSGQEAKASDVRPSPTPGDTKPKQADSPSSKTAGKQKSEDKSPPAESSSETVKQKAIAALGQKIKSNTEKIRSIEQELARIRSQKKPKDPEKKKQLQEIKEMVAQDRKTLKKLISSK